MKRQNGLRPCKALDISVVIITNCPYRTRFNNLDTFYHSLTTLLHSLLIDWDQEELIQAGVSVN